MRFETPADGLRPPKHIPKKAYLHFSRLHKELKKIILQRKIMLGIGACKRTKFCVKKEQILNVISIIGEDTFLGQHIFRSHVISYFMYRKLSKLFSFFSLATIWTRAYCLVAGAQIPLRNILKKELDEKFNCTSFLPSFTITTFIVTPSKYKMLYISIRYPLFLLIRTRLTTALLLSYELIFFRIYSNEKKFSWFKNLCQAIFPIRLRWKSKIQIHFILVGVCVCTHGLNWKLSQSRWNIFSLIVETSLLNGVFEIANYHRI